MNNNKMTDSPLQQSSTNKEIYTPSLSQMKWLDTAIQLMSDNISEIAETCGLDRTNWYNWLKDDEFRLWFKMEWDKRLSGESWKLDVIGMKQAKKDHKYWQDMQRRVGNLRESDQVAIQPTPILQQININVADSKKEEM